MKQNMLWVITLFGLLVVPALCSAAPGTKPMVLMWQVHLDTSDEELRYLSEQGVTLTQSFSAPRRTNEQLLAHLDALERFGLQTTLYLGKPIETDLGCHFPIDVVQRVEHFMDHPALGAWHLIDEPASHQIAKICQRSLYRIIKDIDPETPIMVSTNNNRRFKYDQFFAEDAFDILEMHYYVNPNIERGQRNLIRFFKEYRARDYPVIITLRAYEAPAKPKRRKMVEASFFEQYKYFIEEADVTKNFGFYGWQLSPNLGINQIDSLKKDFEALMESIRVQSDLAVLPKTGK